MGLINYFVAFRS